MSTEKSRFNQNKIDIKHIAVVFEEFDVDRSLDCVMDELKNFEYSTEFLADLQDSLPDSSAYKKMILLPLNAEPKRLKITSRCK